MLSVETENVTATTGRGTRVQVFCAGPIGAWCRGLHFPKRASRRWGNRIGAGGFEPPTSCSQSRRATKLRYAPRKPIRTLGVYAGGSHSSHGRHRFGRNRGRAGTRRRERSRLREHHRAPGIGVDRDDRPGHPLPPERRAHQARPARAQGEHASRQGVARPLARHGAQAVLRARRLRAADQEKRLPVPRARLGDRREHRLGRREVLHTQVDRAHVDAQPRPPGQLLNRKFKDIGIGVARGAPQRGQHGAATYTTDFGYRG